MPGASPLDSCSLCFLEDAFRVSTPKTTAFTRSLDSSHALPELEAKPRPPAMAVYGAAWLQPRAVHGAANKAACLVGARGVDGGAQAGADVRRTEGQVAEALVFDELELLLEQEEAFDESSVHLPHARSLLYRNDANVILLVEPNEKCLVSVDEHATIYRPIHLQQHKFIFHFENKKHLVN